MEDAFQGLGCSADAFPDRGGDHRQARVVALAEEGGRSGQGASEETAGLVQGALSHLPDRQADRRLQVVRVEGEGTAPAGSRRGEPQLWTNRVAFESGGEATQGIGQGGHGPPSVGRQPARARQAVRPPTS